MSSRFGTIILNTSFRYMIPFILVYGVYVLIHGEESPGGGFQAGALFGIAFALVRLVQGEEASFYISATRAVVLAGMGTLIYGLVGLSSLFFNGKFLEYGILPLTMPGPQRHALGILGIEIGVTLCVMATIITIFEALTGRE